MTVGYSVGLGSLLLWYSSMSVTYLLRRSSSDSVGERPKASSKAREARSLVSFASCSSRRANAIERSVTTSLLSSVKA